LLKARDACKDLRVAWRDRCVKAEADLARVLKERDEAMQAKERWAKLAYKGRDELLAALNAKVAVEGNLLRAEAALREAVPVIEGLAVQQAMPDYWYLPALARIRAALSPEAKEGE
jgi:hypothetical protein